MRAPWAEELDIAAAHCARGSVMVLSGAGVSTDSGIPDYRGPSGRLRRTSPMTYAEFTGSESARRRYWARSFIGWRAIASSRPNRSHLALARLERDGLLSGTVTQNVDGLHQAAGSRSVIELHGSLATVRCLACGTTVTREWLDGCLLAANPSWWSEPTALQADGDAIVDDERIARFVVVDCAACGGLLKPDVVFFGESVPKERVERCFALLEASSVLLVVGSSLTVMSGFRFVLHAAKSSIPVVICNQGATRGDDLAACKVEAPLGESLPLLATALSPTTGIQRSATGQ